MTTPLAEEIDLDEEDEAILDAIWDQVGRDAEAKKAKRRKGAPPSSPGSTGTPDAGI